jgi:hypothetical protein
VTGRTLLLALLATAVLPGCAAPEPSSGVDFSHVHGLGYIPETDTILVATHHGLIVGKSGTSRSWDYAGLAGLLDNLFGWNFHWKWLTRLLTVFMSPYQAARLAPTGS